MLSRIRLLKLVKHPRTQIKRYYNNQNKNNCVKKLTSEYHSSQFYIGILYASLISASCYSLNKYYNYKISKRSRNHYAISGFLGAFMSHLPLYFIIPIYIISILPLYIIADFITDEDIKN